MRLLRFSWWCH